MPSLSQTKVWDARNSATLEKFNNEVRDQIFKNFPVLDYMLASGRVRMESGGRKISEALLNDENDNFQPYEYYDLVATQPTDEVTRAFFKWRLYNTAVVVSEQEMLENAGSETRLFDLMKIKIKNAELSMRKGLTTDFFAAQAGKRLDGLGTLISESANIVGELDESLHPYWAPQRITSGVNALNLRKNMRTMRNNIMDGTDKGTQSGIVIVTTQAIHEAYEDQLQDLVRFTRSDQSPSAGLGFKGFQNALNFSEIPLIWDSAVPANTMYFINTNFLGFVIHSDLNFKFSEMRHRVDQHASVAHLQFMGNLTCSARRHQGGIFNISV